MDEVPQNDAKIQISTPSKQHSRWIGEQLVILAEALGETITAERIRIYASDLEDIPQDVLAGAFRQARRTKKFFPKISELLFLCGEMPEQQADAEVRAAWDLLIQFTNKWVGSTVHGEYLPQNLRPWRQMPVLSQRIADVVRRTGGWKAYKCMTEDDQPFLQKRFFEEYKAWDVVQAVPESLLLMAREMTNQLPGEVQKKSAQVNEREPETEGPALVKTMPTPPTDQELAERRRMLEKQAKEVRRKHGIK